MGSCSLLATHASRRIPWCYLHRRIGRGSRHESTHSPCPGSLCSRSWPARPTKCRASCSSAPPAWLRHLLRKEWPQPGDAPTSVGNAAALRRLDPAARLNRAAWLVGTCNGCSDPEPASCDCMLGAATTAGICDQSCARPRSRAAARTLPLTRCTRGRRRPRDPRSMRLGLRSRKSGLASGGTPSST